MLTLGQFREKTKDLPDDIVMAAYSGCDEGGDVAYEVVFQRNPRDESDDNDDMGDDEEFAEDDDSETHLGLPVKGFSYGGDPPWYFRDDIPDLLLTVIS